MPSASPNPLPLQEMLGYLNFSSGKPDARFQKQVNDAFAHYTAQGAESPWAELRAALLSRLDELRESGQAAFRDTTQAAAVINLALGVMLDAYREHHADLLGHLPAKYLFQPFFLVRVFEAVLAQGPPWDLQPDRRAAVVAAVLDRLNDYVGYRPIPVLETKPAYEPYAGEWLRPIPLYLRGAGVGCGPYARLLERTFDILAATPPAILEEAYLDLQLLDEIAVDPRGFDPAHPSYRRPNHAYGEWDPNHLDSKGRYRRYVIRTITLEAIMARLGTPSEYPPQEREAEAAALLAGTMLMASALCGDTPTTHDSSVSLAKLLPKVARNRDAFYVDLLNRMPSNHRRRLREEADRFKQPFGAARQHFNQYLTRQRAAQMQARHLAVLFANMGYPEAARTIAEQLSPASARFLCRIVADMITAQRLSLQGRLAEAAELIPIIEKRIQRGIEIGALVDPWNILGFQARFPLFHAAEDAVHDQRVDELLHLVERTLSLAGRLATAGGATGQRQVQERALGDMIRIAEWWDQFGTRDVSDILPIRGREMADSAAHVSEALRTWHARGDTPADIAFWRKHVEGFGSPKAFTLVIEELLRRGDYKASMALLVYWLSRAEDIALEDPDHSYHLLAMRWMHQVMNGRDSVPAPPPEERFPLAARFLSQIEANAEELGEVPRIGPEPAARPGQSEDDAEDNPFAAAYEGMSYQDSAADGHEGGILEGGLVEGEFALETDGPGIEKRLRFLAGLSRLWRMIAEHANDPDREARAHFSVWLQIGRNHLAKLRELLAELHRWPVPPPVGGEESVMEFERRRSIKEGLLEAGIATCMEMHLAVRALTIAAGEAADDAPETPPWEGALQAIASGLRDGRRDAALSALARFVRQLRDEPLLYIPLEAGGEPGAILRTRLAQQTLRQLMQSLPRAGLLRETYQLLRLVNELESASTLAGRRVTEFDRLFAVALEAVAEALIESAPHWRTGGMSDEALANVLGSLIRPFLGLWIRHAQSLRLSALEVVHSPQEWEELQRFVQRYGGDLFHPRFLTLANIRGIVHHGVGEYLDQLEVDADPLRPIRLLQELGTKISRERAIHWLETILLALSETYEEYKDFTTSTAHSDYGQNLYVLLDFLRLRSSYDRHAWQFKPVTMVHSALLRKGRLGAAELWRNGFARLSREVVDSHLKELRRLEQTHGVRLVTIADRLNERFVYPMELDRLVELIEPAIREADRADSPAFARFREALEPFAENPAGAGLDVPAWIRRCETEAQRVVAAERFLDLDEPKSPLPQTIVSVEEIEDDLPNWEKPLWEAIE